MATENEDSVLSLEGTKQSSDQPQVTQQVSGAGKWTLRPSGDWDLRLHRALGAWGSEDARDSLPTNGGHPSALPPHLSEDGFVGLFCSGNSPSQ